MRSGDSRGSARGRTSGQAGLRTFEQRLPGEGMGMRMGGLGQSSPLLWDHGCTGSRLGCCARCQPHTGVAGSADKGRAGPGTTVMLLGRGGEAAPSRAGAQPRIPDPARSDDSPLTLQHCPGNSIRGVPQREIPFSRQ